MAGELERVHTRIDEVAKDVNDIKVSVATIATTIQMTPKHEEGKCKVLVDHIAEHSKSSEKKTNFAYDLLLRLIPLLVSAGVGGIACYLGFSTHF